MPGPVHDLPGNLDVSGRGYRQELGDSLHQSNDDLREEDRHVDQRGLKKNMQALMSGRSPARSAARNRRTALVGESAWRSRFRNCIEFPGKLC